jgi:hypothetical protein
MFSRRPLPERYEASLPENLQAAGNGSEPAGSNSNPAVSQSVSVALSASRHGSAQGKSNYIGTWS